VTKEAADQGRGGILHFEITPKNINKIVEATEAVVGDCAAKVEILMPFIKDTERPEWLDQISQWKNRYAWSLYPKDNTDGLVQPQAFIERLNELVHPVKDRTTITTGVGQHQMWTAQHSFLLRPRGSGPRLLSQPVPTVPAM
jgi:acetolactate synthase-1/2/3 large subunit